MLDDVQRPAHLHVPPLVSSAGDEVADFAAANGLVLDPWQRWVLEQAMGEDAAGRRSAFEVGLCCPRQNGKSAILEAYMLSALFLDGGMTIYSAHEFKTAQQIWKRFEQLVRQADELRPLVTRWMSSSNEMGLELRDGSRLQFLARSGTQGRGFSANRLIFDEAMILNAASMGAMVPTLSARRNAQIWYAGSAGMAGPESDHWRSVRNRGRSGSSKRLAWFEWGMDSPPMDLRDPDARAATNPGYPGRLTPESLDDELETLEGRDETIVELTRERFGVWDEPDGGGQVIPADVWAAHAEPDRRIVGVPSFALDVSPNRSMAALAVAGDADGRPMVEIPADVDRVDHRPGTAWVVPRVVDLLSRHGGSTVWLTGSAAEALRPDLDREGVNVEALTGPQLAAACGAFFDAATAPAGHGLVHAGQPELDTALGLARRAETDHGWQWGRRKSAGDITPLVAATVALWAHTTAPVGDASAFWI